MNGGLLLTAGVRSATAARVAQYVPTLLVGMDAPRQGYNLRVPKLEHYYGLNHLHYFTQQHLSAAPLFDSERFKNHWVVTLGELRRQLVDSRS